MQWQFDDGGRSAAGFKGSADDCVVRAIAIATETPYRDVYNTLHQATASFRTASRSRAAKAMRTNSPRDGTDRKVFDAWLRERGWVFVPCMTIGSGTRVHLRAYELPSGRIICRLSRHVCAVVDGVVHDTFDPSRDGRRAVYGYYTKQAA